MIHTISRGFRVLIALVVLVVGVCLGFLLATVAFP